MKSHRRKRRHREWQRLNCEILEVRLLLAAPLISASDNDATQSMIDAASGDLELSTSDIEGPRAFPEAEGWGAQTLGGRGGRVHFVTNLNDSGPGSFRQAVEASEPRTVIFRVAGVITLDRALRVASPYLTIAGQTAPSPGITLRMNPSAHSPGNTKDTESLMIVSTHDVILRYLKFRRGDSRQSGDNLDIVDPSHDVIVDHCSFSWATDESIEIWTYERTDAASASGIHRVTIQNSIIAESLQQDIGHWLDPSIPHTPEQISEPTYTDYVGDLAANAHPLGLIVGGHRDFTAWQQVQGIDLHHNLFASNTHRNPRVAARGVRIINNVVFNWFTRAGGSEKSAVVDYIGNVYRHGPLSRSVDGGPSMPARPHFLWHDATDSAGQVVDPEDASIYIAGNIAPAIPEMSTPDNDNWAMLMETWTGDVRGPAPQLDLRLRRTEPQPESPIPVTQTVPTADAPTDLVAGAGATQFLNAAGAFVTQVDYVDARELLAAATDHTRITSRSRIYKTAAQAGGYSAFAAGVSDLYPDADSDGMSDLWESLQGGDFPPNGDEDHDGYTNLEEFLNESDPLRSDAVVRAPGLQVFVDEAEVLRIDEAGDASNSVTVTLDSGRHEYVITSAQSDLFAPGGALTNTLRVSAASVSGGLSMTFRGGNDLVDVSTLSLPVTVSGGAGNDSLISSAGNDVLSGEWGDDYLLGNMGTDSLTGGEGADTLIGGGSHDDLTGGAGNDFILGNGGHDTLRGGGQDDGISGGAGLDTLAETLSLSSVITRLIPSQLIHRDQDGEIVETNTLRDIELVSLVGSLSSESIDASAFPWPVQIMGSGGNDTLTGTAGADTLAGAGGHDLLRGLGGRDQLVGGNGEDLLNGGDGDDQLLGQLGNDTLSGLVGHDRLLGADGHDLLHGGIGNDQLYGGTGDDRISGYADNDRLLGEAGNDTLVGGVGDDTLLGDTGQDVALGQAGRDVVQGQEGANDTLAGGNGSGPQPDDLVVGDAHEINEAFVFDAWWINNAPDELPNLTTLSNPTLSYRVAADGRFTLSRGGVTAVIVDNRAFNDELLPNHAAGYSGVASLTHTARPENLFVPTFSGLNFEFMHDGTSVDRETSFEPRRVPMQLRVINDHIVELYQPATPAWQLESVLRYELLETGTIQMTLEVVPHATTFGNGYIGLLFASYIQQPESRDILFRGHDPRVSTTPIWIRGITPRHGVRATHVGATDGREFVHDADFPLALIFNRSDYRYDEPWYFGISHDMALALMFRDEDHIRFTQSPTGGGAGNPAWDFQFLIPDYEVGKRYQMVMRAQYVPYASNAQIESATRANRQALNSTTESVVAGL